MKTWVEVGGLSDHLPILLQLQSLEPKLVALFKFNPSWIQEDDYRKLVVDTWNPLEDIPNVSYMKQFAKNIQRTKKEKKMGKYLHDQSAETTQRS